MEVVHKKVHYPYQKKGKQVFLLQNFNLQVLLVLIVHGAAPTSAATHSIEFSGPQFEIEESCIAALFGWVQKGHTQDFRASTEFKFMDLVFSFPFSFGLI